MHGCRDAHGKTHLSSNDACQTVFFRHTLLQRVLTVHDFHFRLFSIVVIFNFFVGSIFGLDVQMCFRIVIVTLLRILCGVYTHFIRTIYQFSFLISSPLPSPRVTRPPKIACSLCSWARSTVKIIPHDLNNCQTCKQNVKQLK